MTTEFNADADTIRIQKLLDRIEKWNKFRAKKDYFFNLLVFGMLEFMLMMLLFLLGFVIAITVTVYF